MELLSIAKMALYGIFLNYYCYYVVTGSFIPYGTVLFFGIALGCVGLCMLKDRLVWVGYEVRCWLLYIALSIATMGFAIDSEYAFDSILKFAQRLLIIIMIVYICEKENSIKFALRLLAVDAIGCACAVLYTIDDIQLKLDISSGANLSANDTGALMAFGCFAAMFAFGNRNKTSLFTTLFKFAAIIAMITVIFLAGSRKSILAVIILITLIVIMNGLDYLKHSTYAKLFVFSALGVVAICFVVENLAPYAMETNLYTRLFGRGVERTADSDEVRIELYMQALESFLKNPIAGLGFNNFVLKYGNYTHSTYAEPFACSGLIGLVYLAPYIRMLKRQIELIKLNRYNPMECMKQKEMLAFYISFLFVAIGIPYMYKDNPCIVLALFIASQYISYNKLYNKRHIEERIEHGKETD